MPADHSTVHPHPAAVLEVRRILLEHLAELRGQPVMRSLRSAGGSDSLFCRTQSYCVQWRRCHHTGRSGTPSYDTADCIIRRAARHLGRPSAGRAVVDSTVRLVGRIAGKPPCGILWLRCW